MTSLPDLITELRVAFICDRESLPSAVDRRHSTKKQHKMRLKLPGCETLLKSMASRTSVKDLCNSNKHKKKSLIKKSTTSKVIFVRITVTISCQFRQTTKHDGMGGDTFELTTMIQQAKRAGRHVHLQNSVKIVKTFHSHQLRVASCLYFNRNQFENATERLCHVAISVSTQRQH